MTDKKSFLDGVYDLQDAEATRAYYSDWAASYDDEVLANGYVSPQRVAAAMAAHVEDKGAPLFDLGCGTGLSGEAFAAAGFTDVHGTDFSPGMLEAARTKDVYKTLTLGDLARPIPAEPGRYANLAAVGVFSPSHAPASMIDTALAILPVGGCFGFTLNDHALQEGGYEARVAAVAAEGAGVSVVFSEHGPHLPKLGLGAKVVVLRRDAAAQA